MSEDYDYHVAKAWEHHLLTEQHLARHKDISGIYGVGHPEAQKHMDLIRNNYFKAQGHWDAADALREGQESDSPHSDHDQSIESGVSDDWDPPHYSGHRPYGYGEESDAFHQ